MLKSMIAGRYADSADRTENADAPCLFGKEHPLFCMRLRNRLFLSCMINQTVRNVGGIATAEDIVQAFRGDAFGRVFYGQHPGTDVI